MSALSNANFILGISSTYPLKLKSKISTWQKKKMLNYIN